MATTDETALLETKCKAQSSTNTDIISKRMSKKKRFFTLTNRLYENETVYVPVKTLISPS